MIAGANFEGVSKLFDGVGGVGGVLKRTVTRIDLWEYCQIRSNSGHMNILPKILFQ